jgi:hypothetical protein
MVEVHAGRPPWTQYQCQVCKLKILSPYPPEKINNLTCREAYRRAALAGMPIESLEMQSARGGRAQRREVSSARGGPPLRVRAMNFVKAQLEHNKAGRPLCSEAQIDARAAICDGCSDLVHGACRYCGCPINRNRSHLSKLAMREQECPLRKWRKLATDTEAVVEFPAEVLKRKSKPRKKKAPPAA